MPESKRKKIAVRRPVASDVDLIAKFVGDLAEEKINHAKKVGEDTEAGAMALGQADILEQCSFMIEDEIWRDQGRA